MKHYEIIIIGGGVSGTSIGLGIRKHKHKVLLIDEQNQPMKASRGNFGLVWAQGKGVNNLPYANWCLKAVLKWKDFAPELEKESGIDISYQNKGGYYFSFNQKEFDKHKTGIEFAKKIYPECEAYMLTKEELKKRYPYIGEDVFGASYTSLDGHLNPLSLMKALRKIYQQRGGELALQSKVQKVIPDGEGFTVETDTDSFRADKIVLTAGLGIKDLASHLDLETPIKAVRGQILVTEKIKPFLDKPSLYVQQTTDGSVMMGYSVEDVGHNLQTSSYYQHRISKTAEKIFPFLRHVQVVRSWGSIRIMYDDGMPVYDSSPTYKNAFIVTGHSAISLSSLYPEKIAKGVIEGNMPSEVKAFSRERFNA